MKIKIAQSVRGCFATRATRIQKLQIEAGDTVEIKFGKKKLMATVKKAPLTVARLLKLYADHKYFSQFIFLDKGQMDALDAKPGDMAEISYVDSDVLPEPPKRHYTKRKVTKVDDELTTVAALEAQKQ